MLVTRHRKIDIGNHQVAQGFLNWSRTLGGVGGVGDGAEGKVIGSGAAGGEASRGGGGQGKDGGDGRGDLHGWSWVA